MEIKLIKFSITGMSATVADFLSYFICFHLLLNGQATWIAKTLGFLCGTLVALVLNTKWTFKSKFENDNIGKFFLVYCASLCLNVVVNTSILLSFDGVFILYIAFGIATFSSATFNFIMLSGWVYQSHDRQ